MSKVLVCPAIFLDIDGWVVIITNVLYGRCYCHLWLMLLPLLMLADVIAIVGWCCCHFLWLMPLPLLVIGRCFSHILADVIAIILFINGTMLADVFAILWLMLLPLCCWQVLLPCLADVMPLFLLLMALIILLWLMLCHIVGVLYFSGRSYYQVWLMLLPFVAVWQVLLPLWLMLLPYVAVWQMSLPLWLMLLQFFFFFFFLTFSSDRKKPC